MFANAIEFLKTFKKPALIIAAVAVVVFLVSFFLRFSSFHQGFLDTQTMFVSADQGNSWTNNIYFTTQGFSGYPVTSMAEVDYGQDHSALVIGTGGYGLFVSFNDATSWSKINYAPTDQGYINDLFADSAGNLWVAENYGHQTILIEGTLDAHNTFQWSTKYSVYTPQNAIQAVAVDPARGVVYMTMGKSLLASTDGGKTWNDAFIFHYAIRQLFVTPGNGALYAVTQNAVYKSTNGGTAWSSIVSPAIQGDIGSSPVSFFVDKGNDAILYIGYRTTLLRSIDSGRSWGRVPLLMNIPADITAVYANPRAPYNIYAAAGSNMYVSYNGGDTWQVRNLSTAKKLALIFISIHDPNIVFVGLQ